MRNVKFLLRLFLPETCVELFLGELQPLVYPDPSSFSEEVDVLERGEISFVFLWVLNPIVILFYQNCSWVAPEKVLAANPPVTASIERSEERRQPACAPVLHFQACLE